jgi:RNA polymerase sigma-70 factor (ECF subfamily)
LDINRKLVQNTLNGDVDSFSELISNYQQRIYIFLFRLTLCSEDAEELLQDVFMRVYKYLYTYDKNKSFSTWIYRIALNIFKDYHKRKKRQFATLSYDETVCNYDINAEALPETAFEAKESYKEVVRIINSLKDEQRIAVILKYTQNFTYKEIGEILGITAQNAKMRVSRARKAIGISLGRMNGGGI